MLFNQFNENSSYKYFHGSFKRNTIDFHIGKKSLESWDKESVTEYCTNDIDHILRNNDYTHEFIILKKFLKLFECNCQFEFEEKVLDPILRKLCKKHDRKFEEVQKKVFENECISYEENFN
ncbi:hypothetical protein BH23THE1_BH23THE1_18020 [soil metagenome]